MSSPRTERALVFGDDMRIFLAVVRSLGRAGKEVHAAPFNWKSPALRSRYVHTVHRLPRYSDGAEAWRTATLSLLEAEPFDLVVPCCDDRSILAFDLHREDFVPYNVALPAVAVMEHLFDKERTRALGARLGIPVTPGARLQDTDAAPDLVARYGLPLVIKPRRSYWADRMDGWGKVYIVDTEAELHNLLGRLQDRWRYLVEGYFEGAGVGVSVLAQDGRILHAFQHRRLREGRGGSSSYRVSEPINSDLYEACRRICAETALNGVCMFEFRRNLETKQWVLLETNARFWGSCSLPISLGVDFPRYFYDLLVHRRQYSPVPYAIGIRSRNVVLDGLNLLSTLPRLRGREIPGWAAELGRFIVQPAMWLSRRERSDTFVADDLAPAWAECATLLKGVSQKMVRHRHPELRRRRSEQVI